MKYRYKFLILSFVFAFLSVSLAFGVLKESRHVVVQPSSDGVQRLDVKNCSSQFHSKISRSWIRCAPEHIAGKEVKINFTPTKIGTYRFYCEKKGLFGSHRKKGMEGILEVRQ